MEEEKRTHTKIAGVTYSNEDGTQRQDIIKTLIVGQELSVEHDSTNPFDANCQNLTTDTGQLVGNLKRELAADVRNGQLYGWTYMAKVKDITGKDKHTLGVNIELIAKRQYI